MYYINKKGGVVLDKENINVRLDGEEKKKLDITAENIKWTVSQIVRRALDLFYKALEDKTIIP